VHEQVVTISKAVLVVEDSAAQCELLNQALAEHGFDSDIHVEQGVAAAFSYLHHQIEHHTALPRLILVDLKLTNGSGLDIVHYIRHHDRLHLIPVIILTSSDAHADIQTSYRAGANAYVVKPGTYSEFVTLTRDLCRFWLDWNRTA
jgi:DNA-binding response OmpR family regulator